MIKLTDILNKILNEVKIAKPINQQIKEFKIKFNDISVFGLLDIFSNQVNLPKEYKEELHDYIDGLNIYDIDDPYKKYKIQSNILDWVIRLAKNKIINLEDLNKIDVDNLDEILTEKKLCPKGKAYYNRRKAAGEKPSAYLSGRAVKVCKGLMEEDDLDLHESLRDWFKKEDWVRIDTAGNITGPCGTMKKGNKTTRCLPRAKANSLTKAERAATSRKKAASNKQFVPNTKKAKVRLKK
jgi:hypothetical protein